MFRFSVATLTMASAEMSWQDWKNFYGKVYNGVDDDAAREAVYNANVQTIEEHNARNETWTMAVNIFADLTHEEWVALVSAPPKEPNWVGQGEEHEVGDAASLSSSIDWVQRGMFNDVVDQGHSSACWAHSAAGVLESNWAIKTGSLVKVSEQQLCDCSDAGSCGNGGDEESGLLYYRSHPACSRSSYEFTGRDSSCKESRCNEAIPAGVVTGLGTVQNNADAWKSGLHSQPFTSGVHSDDLGQFYHSGVFSGHGCGGRVNHAVITVGYGTDRGTPYFKIRNSWGKSWGEGGYVRVAQSSHSSEGEACIFHYTSAYPTLSGGGPSPHPSPHPSPSPSPHHSCHDYSGWTDQEGETCSTFEQNSYCTPDGQEGRGWRSSYGRLTDWYDRHHNTPLDACCACGGGENRDVVV